ncbi:MAG: MarR family winged helix-turn-helix transcriptional regulator [Dehalococcoidales bacterium]
MQKQILSESNFDLWLLIGRVNHEIMLARQKELRQYNIPIQQTLFLYTLQSLGPKATISEVAKAMERTLAVTAQHAARMENYGLIKRIKNSPRSNLLRLELTDKGLEMVKLARKSHCVDSILSFLDMAERQQMESELTRILVKAKKYNSAH